MNALQPEPYVTLIVEDDPDVRALAAVLLEETLLDMVEVESAEVALDCLQECGGEVATMFADVRLPGEMDGVQLARKATKLWPTIRIVLTSGDPGTQLNDLPDSVTFMPKPWRGLDVLIQAEKAIHRPEPLSRNAAARTASISARPRPVRTRSSCARLPRRSGRDGMTKSCGGLVRRSPWPLTCRAP
jgi:CheY-like chemotaxis protein